MSNRTTLWYHTIWRKTRCQKIKRTIYPHIKVLGLKGFNLELAHAGNWLAEHSTTGFVWSPGMIYRRPWCRQVNIEASWHLMSLSAVLLRDRQKALEHSVYSCRQRESGNTAFGLAHTWRITTLQKSFAGAVCTPAVKMLPVRFSESAQRDSGDARHRSREA